jgi:hypothetical protein
MAVARSRSLIATGLDVGSQGYLPRIDAMALAVTRRWLAPLA